MTLVYLAGAWLLGVVAGAVVGAVWWPGVAAIAVAALIAAAVERRPRVALIGLLAAGLFVGGAMRYIDQQPPDEPSGIAVHNDGDAVRFRALVADEPDVRGASQRVRLSVREVLQDGDWRPVSGGVLLRGSLFPRHRYGDLIEIEGELETPPSFPDFNYREYLARQGVSSLIAYPESVETLASGQGNRAVAALHDVRRHLGEALGRSLPEPQAALAQGIFLGQRSAIPQDLTDDMNATGTSHLIAISGHNVSLVAGLIISSLAWVIGRRQAALAALVAIAAYTVLTGASPTVVRAAIMGSLFVGATLAGRPGSALPSITLAAALMIGWDPNVARDVSFQLSFAAILGLTYITPALQARGGDLLRRWGVESREGGIAAFVLESGALTTGAVAATLPLIALNFGRVSLVAPLSNLLLVSFFPLILGGSALTAVAGVVWPPAGEVAGWAAWTVLTYMIELARFFAGLPLASFEVSGFGAAHAAGSYLALAAFAWWLNRRRPEPGPALEPERLPSGGLRVRPVWALAGGLAVVGSLAWWAALDAGSGRLSVSVLDVGQGESILVETPAGHRILIDGGPSGRAVTEALGEALPFWDRRIDLIVLTHAQADHMAGFIDVLERYDVRQVLSTPEDAGSAVYRDWRELIDRQDIPYREGRPGQRIDLGGGATMRVLGPNDEALVSGEPNDASLVLKLTWNDASFLLTGDIEVAAEEALLASDADLRSTVLKVPHHGSATSSSAAFLRAVRPHAAVVSAGRDNPFGHPHADVLDRLETPLLLRTDLHGTVSFETDGERLWVEVERGE